MKKTGLVLLWVLTVWYSSAQPLQRQVERIADDVFTVRYTFNSDSLKGFFIIRENFSGKAKLTYSSCKIPFKFGNDQLMVSGDKISKGSILSFHFKLLDDAVSVSGNFQSENFGNGSVEIPLQELRMEKQVQLALAKTEKTSKRSSPVPPKNEQGTNPPASLSPSGTPAAETSGHLLSDTGSHQVFFRVQLAASATPMDKEKLRKLSGLDLPVNEEQVDGYYKYTVGNEKTLRQAQNLLNRTASQHFKKPFVVAYRLQTRITVQQALAEINKSD